MSTYNGEKYLKEQIDSILSQEDVNLDLLVRDDGSTDKTVEILEIYEVDMSKKQIEFAKLIANYKDSLKVRGKLLFYKNQYVTKRENLNLKFRILIGRF